MKGFEHIEMEAADLMYMYGMTKGEAITTSVERYIEDQPQAYVAIRTLMGYHATAQVITSWRSKARRKIASQSE
ncbi:MAG: hypothetical protein WC096_00475 [Sphaerochaetaceae bacterium]